MPVTHFSIIELPDPNVIVSTINNVPIVLNTLYPIAQEANLSFVRAVGYETLSVFSSFKYKTHNQPDAVVSNLASGTIKWSYALDDPQVAPLGNNTVDTIVNDQAIKLIDIVDINEAVEFIDIVSVNGVSNWKLNNNLLFSGERILTNQFSNVNFTALSEGGGPDYSSLDYTVGNADQINPAIVNSSINVDVETELLELSPKSTINYSDTFIDGITFETYNVIEETLILEITGGFPNVNAEVEIAIACPFLALNSFNQVVINDSIIKTANETFNINVLLNLSGKAAIKILHYIVENNADPKTGQTTATLLNVDGNTAVVSLTNFTDSLTTNII